MNVALENLELLPQIFRKIHLTGKKFGTLSFKTMDECERIEPLSRIFGRSYL